MDADCGDVRHRLATVSAMTDCDEPKLSEMFMAHILARNVFCELAGIQRSATG
jgi:hypothetical protein